MAPAEASLPSSTGAQQQQQQAGRAARRRGRAAMEEAQPSSAAAAATEGPGARSPRSGRGGFVSLAFAVVLALLLAAALPSAEAHLRGAERRREAQQQRQQQQQEPPVEGSGRNKTAAIVPAVPGQKVGRVKVPNAGGLTLSRIAYGSLHFPEFKDDIEGLYRNLDTCLKLGVTTIDLSDVYGWVEDGHGAANDIFAKVLKAHPDLRNRMELVAKFGIRLSGGYHVDLSKEWILESINRYLKLFNTKHVDVFMIHNPDPNMDYEEVAKAFKEIKAAGKAKAFGISNFHKWEYEALRDAMAKEGLKLSVHEMETSVLHPDKINDGTVDYFSKGENEMAILGWGPLGGDPYGGKNLLFGNDGEREKRIVGTLADKGEQLAVEEEVGGKKQVTTFRADEVAVAWLLHHPAHIVPILGTTAVERIISQSIPPEKIKFTDGDYQAINEVLHY